MRRIHSILHAAVPFWLLPSAAVCSEVPLPPPVRSPAGQIETFQLAEPGCRIELVASEPMVQDPVAIQFDGQGRLWVVEMRAYMQDIERSGVKEPIGRVSVLQDTDGDGIMDKTTVFADKLVLPRSVAVRPDGVLIAENKPLWFFEDANGDLVAEKKTPIDPKYAKDSIEHSANGLYRAMDNWIYNAKEGHRYRRQGKTWIREKTETRGQWGICQDNFGRLFYNYNHSQLHADVVPPNALTRNPNHQPTTGLSVGVTTTNQVFPIRPNLATNRGYIPGALDESGSIKQFTSACAPLIYREALFPNFAGNAFVCETAGNLVKRNIITGSGIMISGAPAYSDKDFLASADERFRPVWLATGPDGALYIADMYRGIVQDGPHMSPYLREHCIARKMDEPIHLGRIWRIIPEDFDQPKPPNFAAMAEEELVEQLANPGGWWRDQAQMHLVERNLKTAVPALRKMALSHENALARLHAIWILDGLDDPEPETLTACLTDDSAAVRSAAIRVLSRLGLADDSVAEEMRKLSEDSPNEGVVLQMILTLGDLEIEAETRFVLLAELLLPRAANPLMRDAALSSLTNRELAFLKFLWPKLPETETKIANSGFSFLIEALAQAVTKSRDADSIGRLLALLDFPSPDWKQQAAITGISVLGAELTANPVKLGAKPKAANHHKPFAQFFAWPGHVPTPPANTAAVKALNKKEQALFVHGRQIYLSYCVACHGGDGKGMKLLAPPLAGSDWVMGSEERLARVLFHGLLGPITVSGKRYAAPDIQPVMPPLANLGNREIAAVLTYIRRSWGNTADPISSDAINKLRIAAQGRVIPWTEEELRPFAESR